MKSEFKSGDIVIFNNKLFLIKQGLASTTQPKKWEKVQFEYLAYHLRDVGLNKKVEVDTEKVYVLKESEMKKAVLPPLLSEEIDKSVYLRGNNQEEPQEDAEVLDKGRCVRVKGESGIYRILRVESSSCWLDKLIIKGNDISAEIVPVRKEYEELEWLSPYEESLLRREVEPRAMSTIEQELRLEEMNSRFVESMTYDEKSFGDLIREVESLDDKEIVKVDSFLKRLFDRIREFIVSIFSDDSKESITQPEEEVITFENLVRKLRYSIEHNQYNDGLIELYNLLRNVKSVQKKESIRVRLGETILKTIEMVYVNSQKDKVNALLDNIIMYIESLEDVDLGKDIELEHDYVKKLIKDSKAVDKVTSVDKIIKSDGYEVSAIECDKE